MAQMQNQASDERSGQAPSGAGQQTGQVGAGEVVPSLRGSAGGSFLRVAPYIALSERYDSNVLFTPDKISDYVTNIRAGVRTQYRNDVVDGFLTGGFISEVYARNPGLNYVGVDANLNANLDNAVGRMIRGLGLSIMDSFMYTPQPPAFVTPEVPANSFIRGIQVARNNTLINNANLLSTYAIAPLIQFNASYSHQMIKFLEQTERAGALFDTTVQSFGAGPEYRLTPTQSMGMSYQFMRMSFQPSGGGGTSSNSTIHGLVTTWKASLTRELTAEISPGLSLVTTIPEKLQWTARGLLQWSDARTTAGLSYTRGLFPSFTIEASVLISDNISASLVQRLSSQWSVAIQSDYAHNTSVGTANLRFESYGQTVSVNYDLFGGMVASASMSYYYFVYGASGAESKFSREMAMLSVSKHWN